jgi:hypothetical protein
MTKIPKLFEMMKQKHITQVQLAKYLKFYTDFVKCKTDLSNMLQTHTEKHSILYILLIPQGENC